LSLRPEGEVFGIRKISQSLRSIEMTFQNFSDVSNTY
jgi:hypothetical protein